MEKTATGTDPRGLAYAGSTKCGNCHKTIHDHFAKTAHSLTSAVASPATVKGNFSKDNEYFYRPDVKVAMEARDSGLFEVAYQNNEAKRVSRFDIVIGSGRKAQTYLYWDNDNIFQLPVSWSVAANSWVNSPNYPPHQVRFDRNIPVGCFECHGSYIKVTGQEALRDRYMDDFDRNQLLYGIDCERCHGPAQQHVAFHEQHPQEKKASFMVSYATLSRQQRVDMCAVCHSGLHQTIQSTFNFHPGDTLNNHFFPPAAPVDITTVDVHGSQAQLLQASQCFLKSNNLTCTSCHDVHVTEKNNMAVFSQRCMSCHNTAAHSFCTVVAPAGTDIKSNCIDCHMPATPSKLITLLSNGRDSATPNQVRTHFISIYK